MTAIPSEPHGRLFKAYDMPSTLDEYVDKQLLITGRAEGNTTRQTDYGVQMFFTHGAVIAVDHYDFGADKNANLMLAKRIEQRLGYEHRLKMGVDYTLKAELMVPNNAASPILVWVFQRITK